MPNRNRATSSRVLLLVVSLASIAFNSFSWAQNEHPLHLGMYSQEQANRGETAFMASCASCHANDLRGNSNSPGLVGVGFLFLWEERPLAELFSKMRDEMPTDRPGSLPAATYRDLLAFILQQNGYPSGTSSLNADILESAELVIIPPP